MRLYNSLSRALERFQPRPGRTVQLYVCGITPYDTTHLGHAFTYVTFDVLIRHLETVHGWPVRYVQNVTDVDDDILRRAAQTDQDWQALGEAWARRFTADMSALRLRPPDAFPTATAHMPQIQRLVAQLVEAGVAYAVSGSVYFRSAAAATMGLLTDEPDLLAVANERGNDPSDDNKEHPLDFVLWQRGRPGEPAWRSPWGDGRPGWHVECSAMSRALLDDQIDVHGGGADLAFPHHGCELAQAAALGGPEPWVRFWMHVAMVGKDGQKMSKSLGNLVMVSDLLLQHEPDAVRLCLLRHHYRQPWQWERAELEECDAWARTLHAAAGRRDNPGTDLDPISWGPRFVEALDDDLDTPGALRVVLALADAILEAPAGTRVAAAQDLLRTLAGRVLGLWLKPRACVDDEEARRHAWPHAQTGVADLVLPE